MKAKKQHLFFVFALINQPQRQWSTFLTKESHRYLAWLTTKCNTSAGTQCRRVNRV